MTRKELLVRLGARAVAASNGDDYDLIPASKAQWVSHSGIFNGRARDVNEPYQSDYDDMAEAILDAIDSAGFAIVPKEPTPKMLLAGFLADTAEAPEEVYRAMIDAAIQEQPK